MKRNVHLVNLEYGHSVVYRCKTHIHFVANKMDGYLQFFTKLTAKAILSSTFQNVRSVTYNMQVRLKCNKCHIQYVGKGETDFHLRLNNHRKKIYKADAIPALRHFAMKDHIFNRDASFIIVEQIRKSTLSRDTMKNLLKERENFWILKLETLKPKGINQELNK